MAIVAAAIDTTRRADFSTNGLFTLRVPVWDAAGAKYFAAVHHGAEFSTAGVWKSEDGGETWTLMDDANAPYQCDSLANFKVGDVVYFLVGSRADQGNVALRLYSFTCGTDAWAAIDTAGPSAHWASGLVKRGSDFVAIYGTNMSENLFTSTFNGSWSTGTDIGAVTGPHLVQFDVWCCLDREDRSHVFIHDLDPITFMPANWWHVSIETDNSIGVVDLLPSTIQIHGGAASGGDTIALGVGESSVLKLLAGTPLDTPTWALSSMIDSNQPSGVNLVLQDGGWGLVSLDGAQQVFRLAQSTDLSTWSVAQIYDETTDDTPVNADASWGVFPPGAWSMTGQLLVGSNYRNTALSAFTSFYIGSFSLTGVTPGARLRNTFE